MIYRDEEIETADAFVVPTTRAGRQLVRNALREPRGPCKRLDWRSDVEVAPPCNAREQLPPIVALRKLMKSRSRSGIVTVPIYPSFVSFYGDFARTILVDHLSRLNPGNGLRRVSAPLYVAHRGTDVEMAFCRWEETEIAPLEVEKGWRPFHKTTVLAGWHPSCRNYALERACMEQADKYEEVKRMDEDEARKRETERFFRVLHAFRPRQKPGNKIKQLRALGIVAG